MANYPNSSTQSNEASGKLAAFSPKAKRFFSRPPEQDRFLTLLEGAVRSGKTWAMMVKILALCKYQVAGQRVLIGNSKESVRRNVLTDIATFVGKKNYRLNMNSGQLWIYGVEWLVIGVSNEGSERAIRGMTAGVIVWDEITLAPENVFDMAMSRLSPEGARLYATTNPDTPYHYLITKYFERPEFAPYFERILFDLDDNYSLSPETKARIRASYSGVFYQRFILGLWVIAQGAIYKDALADENYYDDATRPIGLLGQGGYVERFIPADCGTVNQTVYLDVLDDGETYWINEEWVWDSHKEGRQKTDHEHADDLQQFQSGLIGPARTVKRGALTIVDPSAASFKQELSRRGIWYTDADNEVLDGIRVLSSLFVLRKIKIHRGNCPTLVKQLNSYAWDAKAAKRGEEQPLKIEDHACDAARYFAKTKCPAWRLAS